MGDTDRRTLEIDPAHEGAKNALASMKGKR